MKLLIEAMSVAVFAIIVLAIGLSGVISAIAIGVFAALTVKTVEELNR